MKFPTGLLLGGLALNPAFAAETDWPQFRGAASNPVSDSRTLPSAWSTTENVEWLAEIPGRGWSSPIVSGGRVFLTTATTDGPSKEPQTGTEYSNEYAAELARQGLSQEEVVRRLVQRDIELPEEVELHYYLYCLDVDSGEVVWRQEIFAGHPPGGRHRKNSFTSETPVTDGERVYVYIGNLGLYAYDFDGDLVWSTPLEAHPIYLDFGTGSSPALAGDQLLIVNDNEEQQFLASFDKTTGKQLWRVNRDTRVEGEPPRRSGWATPYVWKNALRTEIVAIGPGTAVSYDLEGRELWRLPGISVTPAPSPFDHDGQLILDAGRGRGLYAIEPGASGELTTDSEAVSWMAERAGSYIPTPVAYEGSVYVLDDRGFMARYDSATGEQDYKARINREGAAFTSSPWAYDGKVFCLSEEGDTYVLGAGDQFELLRVNPLGEMAMATPAIAGDRLLIRTAGRLYSIREEN